MIYGQPEQFAVMLEVLESSDDNYWQFGLFNFIVDDIIVPAKGSNYTINIAVNYLKDSVTEILTTKPINVSKFNSNQEIMQYIAHSHGEYLDIDNDDIDLSKSKNKKGVDLNFYELTDIGFYIFYYQTTDSNNEFIIYSENSGKDVFIKEFNKGTVFDALNKLPSFQKN